MFSWGRYAALGIFHILQQNRLNSLIPVSFCLRLLNLLSLREVFAHNLHLFPIPLLQEPLLSSPFGSH